MFSGVKSIVFCLHFIIATAMIVGVPWVLCNHIPQVSVVSTARNVLLAVVGRSCTKAMSHRWVTAIDYVCIYEEHHIKIKDYMMYICVCDSTVNLTFAAYHPTKRFKDLKRLCNITNNFQSLIHIFKSFTKSCQVSTC